jgi:hypothetical protein
LATHLVAPHLTLTANIQWLDSPLTEADNPLFAWFQLTAHF